MDENQIDLAPGATDRRTALKKAAAAGVVAWTTPAVQVLSNGTAPRPRSHRLLADDHRDPGTDREHPQVARWPEGSYSQHHSLVATNSLSTRS